MTWPTVKLGDCVRLINGRAYSQHELLDSGTPIIRIQNLNGGDRWYFSNLELSEEKYCNRGDLLFAWSASFGPYIWEGEKSIYHYHIWKVVPFKNVDKSFIFHLLNNITQQVKEASHGASMLHMTKSGMEAWPIKLPPIAEQKRISEILDKAGKINRKREQAIAKLDELTKSTFIEMFGDPLKNNKNLPKQKLTEFFKFKTGKLDSNAAVVDGKYPFFTCAKEDFLIDDFAFDEEALLLAGNNANADYSVKHYIGKFNAYQRTYVINLTDQTNTYQYAKAALEFMLKSLKHASKGSSTKYLTMGIFNRMDILIPSIELQHKFKEKIKCIEQIKNNEMKNQVNLDRLFRSLQNKAFTTGFNA